MLPAVLDHSRLHRVQFRVANMLLQKLRRRAARRLPGAAGHQLGRCAGKHMRMKAGWDWEVPVAPDDKKAVFSEFEYKRNHAQNRTRLGPSLCSSRTVPEVI